MTFAIPVQRSTNWTNKPADGSKQTIHVMNNDFRYMKFTYLHCSEETNLRDPPS